jgi:hypothetical protein
MFDDTENNPFSRRVDSLWLTIIVHTASFEEALLASNPLADRLLGIGEHGRYRVVWTPTDNEEVAWKIRRSHAAELGEYEVDDDWVIIKTPMPVPSRHRVSRVGDWRRLAMDGSGVTILDELFTNPIPVDLFVVAEGDPFLERDPRRRNTVCPEDAFNLIRILAASRSNEDSFYYQYRAAKLFPALDSARVAMSIARDHGFPPELSEQIESLKLRIELLLRAADSVGHHALRRPDGRAPGQCSYHLGYFIMLVTGLFDELAWTISRRYSLQVKAWQTVLRQRQDATFFDAIKGVNAALHAYLGNPATQAIIELFYPARDQLQHRAIIPSRLVDKPRPTRVLAQLPDDTIREIQGVSSDGGADWGMVTSAQPAGQIDPYLFTLAAVDAVAGVANRLLSLLDWERYADRLPMVQQEEVRARFKTGVGIGFWSRHEVPIPPYY